MTVTTNTSRISYTGDGASTVFAIPFIFLNNADIDVYVNGVQVTTGFTTTGAGLGTGNVTFAVAPAAAAVVLLVRNPDFLQNTDLPSNGPFPSSSVEEMADKAMIGLQRVSDLQSRSLTLNEGDPFSGPLILPLTADRPFKFLLFDANGLPSLSSGSGTDTGLRSDLAAATGATLIGGQKASLVSGAAQVVSSIAALRALLKTSASTRAFVTGYYAQGDGGGGAYWYDSSDTTSADNGGSIIVASDGARWKLTQTFPMSIKQFGAKGDGATDDRVAIQAAINATPINGTLYIPATTLSFYSVSKGAGNYCLQVIHPLNIVGDGFYSAINPDATATALVDTFDLVPAATYGFWGMTWDNFTIGNPNTGARHGRHGIFIDTQAAGSQLPKPIFRRLSIMQGDGTLPNAIKHLNNGTNNVNGGMYAAEIVDCPNLKGGITLSASGDSNIIQRNIITGTGIGITFALVSGASLLSIMDNNITTDGGAILGTAGPRFRIINNNMEQQVATTGSTVMVNISAADGTMVSGEIRGNHMGAFTGSNMTSNITLGANTVGCLVENNTLLNANAAFAGPCITNAGTRNRIGTNQYGTNITTTVTDTGTGTVGVKKTITLLNSWVTVAGFPAPYYIKDLDGFVHLHGEISSGTATINTILATLPADVYPSATQDFPCVAQNAGTPQFGGFTINGTNGNILIQAGANGQFGLNCCYRAANAGVIASDL